jgi:glycosyltransferase involved in cell wall biosynthesis
MNDITSKKVTILLSTFNGAKFLQQQLNTLYNQTYPNLKILVRDDGSSDSTLNILKVEQKKSYIEILEGHENLGPAQSFFELLRYAALTDTDYVAFCDQDDIWLPNKIGQAVLALAKYENTHPVMYCTRIEIVDENLNHIRYGYVPRKIGFGNALVECITTGCTIVLNRKAIDLLCEELPNRVQMHDWWCYVVVSCFGEIVYDETITLRYRQHSANVIGVAKNSIDNFCRRYARFFGKGRQHRWCSEHATAILNIYSNRIPLESMQTINKLLAAKQSIWHRLLLVFSSNIWRQKCVDNFTLRILILLNRI